MPRKLSSIKCSLFQSIDVCLFRTPIFIILCEVDRFVPSSSNGLIIEEVVPGHILRIYFQGCVVFDGDKSVEVAKGTTIRKTPSN